LSSGDRRPGVALLFFSAFALIVIAAMALGIDVVSDGGLRLPVIAIVVSGGGLLLPWLGVVRSSGSPPAAG
jgi:hypothetical protein